MICAKSLSIFFAIIAIIAIAVVVITSSSTSMISASPLMGHCTQDNDCVPVNCCHAGFCVNKEDGPKCDPKTDGCGDQCHIFSLDCGGHCACDKTMGKCEAIYGNGTYQEFVSHQKRKKYGYYRAKVGSGYKKGHWH